MSTSDFFGAYAPNGATATVEVYFSSLDGDIDLFVYDEAGSVVGQSTTVDDNEFVTFTNTSGAGQLYYFEMRRWSGACVPYDYQVVPQ